MNDEHDNKRKRKSKWTHNLQYHSTLLKAIEEYRQGQKLCVLKKKYNIPPRTLKRYARDDFCHSETLLLLNQQANQLNQQAEQIQHLTACVHKLEFEMNCLFNFVKQSTTLESLEDIVLVDNTFDSS